MGDHPGCVSYNVPGNFAPGPASSNVIGYFAPGPASFDVPGYFAPGPTSSNAPDSFAPGPSQANPGNGPQRPQGGRGGRRLPRRIRRAANQVALQSFVKPPPPEDIIIRSRLFQVGGPTFEVPSYPPRDPEFKFSARNWLTICNLDPAVTEKDLKILLEPYGEIKDLGYAKKKKFANVHFDLHANAQAAKSNLQDTVLCGKSLKIVWAPSKATVKVKNLPAFVSNELLKYAFEVFGKVEWAQVLVDAKGAPTGEGIVEFTQRSFATTAVRQCSERCYFLTDAIQPCVVEHYQYITESDGLPEKFFPRDNLEFRKARGQGPRLSDPDTFEHEYGTRWKQIIHLYEEKRQALDQQLKAERNKLLAEVEFAREQHDTDQLKKELQRREMLNQQQKRQFQMQQQRVFQKIKRTEQHLKDREVKLLHRPRFSPPGFHSNVDDGYRSDIRDRSPVGSVIMEDEMDHVFSGERPRGPRSVDRRSPDYEYRRDRVDFRPPESVVISDSEYDQDLDRRDFRRDMDQRRYRSPSRERDYYMDEVSRGSSDCDERRVGSGFGRNETSFERPPSPKRRRVRNKVNRQPVEIHRPFSAYSPPPTNNFM